MTFLWLILIFIAGFWISEWPRYAFSGDSKPLKPGEMESRESRYWAWAYQPLVFILIVIFLLFGILMARAFSPALTDTYWGPWLVLLMLSAAGIAVGTVELVSGLTPDRFLFDSQAGGQRFYVDRDLAQQVGCCRLVSCLTVNALLFLAL